jgi:hypothetical protein
VCKKRVQTFQRSDASLASQRKESFWQVLPVRDTSKSREITQSAQD